MRIRFPALPPEPLLALLAGLAFAGQLGAQGPSKTLIQADADYREGLSRRSIAMTCKQLNPSLKMSSALLRLRNRGIAHLVPCSSAKARWPLRCRTAKSSGNQARRYVGPVESGGGVPADRGARKGASALCKGGSRGSRAETTTAGRCAGRLCAGAGLNRSSNRGNWQHERGNRPATPQCAAS